MASVLDVAAYILKRKGPMTATKLEKLVYYSQAWHLVWEDRRLFQARIEAWANGPVAPTLYAKHRLQYTVSEIAGGDADNLSDDEKDSINVVLKTYGDASGYDLSVLTHGEKPWIDARRGLAPGDRGTSEITPTAMAEYYGSLV